jgi:hypothetical protein
MSFLPLIKKTRNFKLCISSLEWHLTHTNFQIMLDRGVPLPTGLRWLRETQISAHLQNTCVQRAKVWEEGRNITDFPNAIKLVILQQSSEISIRLPTAEADKFTKQPTYNIHKSINNKGTRQQYKNTESKLPRSWCLDSTSPKSRDCEFERRSRWRHFH